MTLSAGDRLGRYKILGPLGAGGMGKVYHMGTTYTLPQMMAYQLWREIVPMRGRGRTVRLRPHHEFVSV